MATTIQEYVRAREIVSLYHFTRIENLPSILKNGLHTLDYLNLDRDLFGIPYLSNDKLRLDGTDAICTSISFPNYRMFYKLRCDDVTAEWAIIELYAAVLWLKRCAFCVTNAADNLVTTTPLEERHGLDALQKMFDDFGGKTRASLKIPNKFPTNPQAEVLVFDNIETNLIRRVYFQKDQTRVRFVRDYPIMNYHLNGNFFSYRCDWEHWR